MALGIVSVELIENRGRYSDDDSVTKTSVAVIPGVDCGAVFVGVTVGVNVGVSVGVSVGVGVPVSVGVDVSVEVGVGVNVGVSVGVSVGVGVPVPVGVGVIVGGSISVINSCAPISQTGSPFISPSNGRAKPR